MSFFDIIANIFEKFMKENKKICEHCMKELFNIEGDINKLNNMKKNRDIMADIDTIFSKHISNNYIYEAHRARFSELKSILYDIYMLYNIYNCEYYDELIKVNSYNIEED